MFYYVSHNSNRGNSTLTLVDGNTFTGGYPGWSASGTGTISFDAANNRVKVTGNSNTMGVSKPITHIGGRKYLFTAEVDKTAFTPQVTLRLTHANGDAIHTYPVSGLGKKYITTALTLPGPAAHHGKCRHYRRSPKFLCG